MNNEFKKNAEDIESEGPFSSAARNAIAGAQLVDHADGRVELVTDRLGFSLLVGQFEAMETRGFDPVMRNENHSPGKKSLIFSAKDADVVRRICDQCKTDQRAYLDVLEQRGTAPLVSARKHPGQGL